MDSAIAIVVNKGQGVVVFTGTTIPSMNSEFEPDTVATSAYLLKYEKNGKMGVVTLSLADLRAMYKLVERHDERVQFWANMRAMDPEWRRKQAEEAWEYNTDMNNR